MAFALRLPWRRRRRAANPDGSMSLMEHLHELRNRLAVAVLAIVVGIVLGYVWWDVSPFGLSSLGDLVTEPYCGLQEIGTGGSCQLLQTSPFEGFNTRLKVGAAAGAVLSSPVWLYQLWAFITPGLYRNERRFALGFVGIASVLFAAGAVLAYLVVPAALRFLTAVADEQFTTALTADRYIGLLLTLLLVFGISFELPLLVVMLNRVGVLPYAKLKAWQRGIIFGLFVLAAVATPGQDPISMLALAASLVVLFEVAVLIARVHDKRTARRLADAGLLDVDPDEPSPLRHVVEPVAPAPPPSAGPAPAPAGSGGATRAPVDDVT